MSRADRIAFWATGVVIGLVGLGLLWAWAGAPTVGWQ